MHSICVWNMIKESKPLQTRYETTHIYDRYYIRTHQTSIYKCPPNMCAMRQLNTENKRALKVSYPICGIYRFFEETWCLSIIEKKEVWRFAKNIN